MDQSNHEDNDRKKVVEAEAIVDRLRAYADGDFPLADVKRALALKSEITPLLLRHLENTALDLEGTLERDEWFLSIFSIYTLCYFRESSALEPILAICRQPIEHTDKLLGDAITEDLHRLLASTYNGEFTSLKAIILNRKFDEFLRASVFRTFIALYHWNAISRESLVEYVDELLDNTSDDDTMLLIELEDACYILKDEPLLAKLAKIVDPSELDVSFYGKKEIRAEFSIESQKRIEYVKKSSHYDQLSDPADELSSWSAFHEEKSNHDETYIRRVMPRNDDYADDFDLEPIPPLERVAPKLGRNDSCHCLSGKKYKKCCLPLETEKRIANLKEVALKQDFVKEVEKHISRGYAEFPNFSIVCVHLLKAWDLLKVKMDPLFPSLEYIEHEYKFEIDLIEFFQKLDIAFMNAAIKDKTDAEKGLIFYREALQLGIDSYNGGARSLKGKMAVMLHFTGQVQDADALVLSIIDEWPDRTEGYWCAAQLAKLRSAPPSEVLMWYEKALENHVTDADEYDLNDLVMKLKTENLKLEERKVFHDQEA